MASLLRYPRRGMLPALALVLLLPAACMRPVTVDSTWVEGADRDQAFANMLVVGVSPNYNVRCRYESLVVSNLRAQGVTASTSCAHLNSTQPLTVEGVAPVVRKLGADAVLVSELLGRDDRIVEGGDSETRGEAYYKPIGYGYAYRYRNYGGYGAYGNYGLPVTYVEFTAEQSAFALETSVVVASHLFRVDGAEPVFSVQITAKNQKSREAVLYALSDGVAERLDGEGLLARNQAAGP